MNIEIKSISARQNLLVGPGGQKLNLPIDCYVSSTARSKSGKTIIMVIYQNDPTQNGASYYFGVLCVKQCSHPFSLHLQKMELMQLPFQPFIWKVISVNDSMVASFEMGRHFQENEEINVRYTCERWRLVYAKTGHLLGPMTNKNPCANQ